MIFIYFLAGNLLVSAAVTAFVAWKVHKRFNPKDGFNRLMLMWLGYSGANLLCWMVGFYNSGYTAFGAVLYGGIVASIFVLLFSVMLMVVVLSAIQNRAAG